MYESIEVVDEGKFIEINFMQKRIEKSCYNELIGIFERHPPETIFIIDFTRVVNVDRTLIHDIGKLIKHNTVKLRV